MNKAELRAILHEAIQSTPSGSRILSTDEITSLVRVGVKQAFTEIGIDGKSPLEMQRDFAFIRSARKAVQSTFKTARATAVGVVVTGLLAVLWIGIRAVIPVSITVDKAK